MAQWGSDDQANNSPLWGPALLKQTPNTDNRDALFGNTSANGFGTGETIGVFGVSATEMGANGELGALYSVTVTNPGSGYSAIPTVSFTGGDAEESATAVATMKLVSLTVAHGGNNYAPGDLLTPSDGTATVNALINVVTTEIRSVEVNAGGTGYSNGDVITLTTGTGTHANATVTTGESDTIVASLSLANNGIYTVNPTITASPTTNTTGTGTGLTVDVTTKLLAVAIANAGIYTVLPTLAANPVSNVTGIGVSANINLVVGVSNVNITDAGTGYDSAPNVTFSTGNATATALIFTSENSGVGKTVAHSGWVLRKAGTGGRAGRVMTEVLVAGGISGDASDDEQYPEA